MEELVSVWIDLMACGGDMGDSASDLTSLALVVM